MAQEYGVHDERGGGTKIQREEKGRERIERKKTRYGKSAREEQKYEIRT